MVKAKEIALLHADVVYSATYGATMDEERGFIIRDRRGGGDGSAEKTGEAEPRAQAAGPGESAQSQPVPPVNFLTFVYSMGTSALMYLGEPIGEGATGPPPNLTHAQEIIDILTMLESKTKGNLTPEEDTLLQEMLYTLRIKFVERAKRQS